MKQQPLPDYQSNDEVQTPLEVANLIVDHFKPAGRVLEPCRGKGAFYSAIRSHHALLGNPHGWLVDWCEIKEGIDFYDHQRHMDWIVTNPPFSLMKATKERISFLEKAFQVSNNVVFLLTLNHAIGSKARNRIAKRYGFGVREILLLDTPPEPWPASGFQVAAVHWKKDYRGVVRWTDKTTEVES